MSIRPTSHSDFVRDATLPSSPQISSPSQILRTTHASQDIIRSFQAENICSSFFSKIFQWLKQLFPCLFGAAPARTDLTAQELEERIRKGVDFINNSVDHHLGNPARNLLRDRFLVRMSHHGEIVISSPTSHPVDLDQFKRSAIAKFEAMMRRPNIRERSSDDYLSVETFYFARQVRRSDGALSPFVISECEQHSRDFRQSNTADHVGHGIWRFYGNELRTWLNEQIPASDPERQGAISYALGAINW
ncbi:MAG: hypothetical protein JSS60_07810 [Verrucomicrobia bacterium]|nr:hypothetical protein [Verrucomicrobiota bacterium]